MGGLGGLGRGRGGVGMGLISLIGRKFGMKGIIVMVIAGVILFSLGVNPLALLGGGGASGLNSGAPVKISPQEEERFEFVERVLAGTEDVWTEQFKARGITYRLPVMQVYRGRTSTACGTGSAQMGPFYCPGDEKIYIDLSFYDELAETFNAPGDFAQAYVIAHEVGHHVQHLLGTTKQVSARRGQSDYNQYSVRLELQADFYAGMWAKHSIEYFKIDREDIQEAMRAAHAIGDDHIQGKTQGKIMPHAFTHGTSEQRMRWFNRGLQSGRMEDGDTFSQPYSEL